MLNKTKTSCYFPSKNVPKKIIESKISSNEYFIRDHIGKGIKKSVVNELNEEITISISLEKYKPNIECESGKPKSGHYNFKEGKKITLLTDHGHIIFYNYIQFFQSLTGFYFGKNKNENKVEDNLENIFPIIVSLMPKSIVDIFGFFSLAIDSANDQVNDQVNDSNKVKNEIFLLFKVKAHDYTALTHISADYDVLMSLIKQPFWEKIKPENYKKELLPRFSPCLIGKSRILMNDYKSLQKGDLIVLDEAYFDVNGVGSVPVGYRYAMVSVNEYSLKRSGVNFISWDDGDENL